MRWTLPNLLTLMRIILIPVYIAVFYLPFDWARPWCAVIFGAAAVTDWLDGYLARRWGQTSAFGAFLDPVADKLMVAVALILLVQTDPRIVLTLPVLVIVGREITVSALREWMAGLGERARVAVSLLAKFKTAAQMLAIALLIYADPRLPAEGNFIPWDLPVYAAGLILLYIAAALTLWSMILYLRAAWPLLRGP